MEKKAGEPPAFKVKFWGVRGSVPSPLDAIDVEGKIVGAVSENAAIIGTSPSPLPPEEFVHSLPFHERGTYGGNTSCVEVRAGGKLIVLDAGTGIKDLGKSLMPEMFANNGLEATFLLSHMHWDHIQGMPFFAPLFINKYTGILNRWSFYGGTAWQQTVETCLQGQMHDSNFPVSWKEIEKITGELHMSDVCDRMPFSLGEVKVRTRKLDHPQETYGWRLEHQGKVVAYATDNEPRDPREPDPRLLDLAMHADLLIADCQYTREVYLGREDGVSRYGWGHSYPEAVATLIEKAEVKHAVLFHHDPNSSDAKIHEMEDRVRDLLKEAGCSAHVTAAYEGLEIFV